MSHLMSLCGLKPPRRDRNEGYKSDDKQNKFRSIEVDSSKTLPPPIFQLNADCLEEIFDYLNLRDLSSISRTCKRFHSIAGNYFQQNYSALEFRSKRDGIYTTHNQTSTKLMGFDNFIQSLLIRGFLYSSFENGLRRFQYINANCNKSLRRIRFENVELNGREIECIREIMSNVETVVIDNCRVKRKFYEKFPEICVNLRELSVIRFQCNRNVLKRTGNEWLLRNWPKIKHLEWTQATNGYRIDEIERFFELNPTVRRFSTNYSCLWMTRHLIFEAGVQLNELIIEFDRASLPNINFIYSLLNDLHQKGIFKRLFLVIKYFNQRFVDGMSNLLGLEGLTLGNLEENADFTTLVNLKSLKITNQGPIVRKNVEMLAIKLKNLEHIYFKQAEVKDFMPFIQHLPKLKRIKIDFMKSKDFNGILNLRRLNKQRKLLEKPRKLILFVDERVFIATKWAEEKTEFNLIEMRRAESMEWVI